MSQMEGVEVQEKKGAKLKYRMYVTRKMMDMQLEELELSVRAFHSLKRAGYDNVGDLLDALEQGMDLRHIRNCGATSIREIQERLFLHRITVFAYSPKASKFQWQGTSRINPFEIAQSLRARLLQFYRLR